MDKNDQEPVLDQTKRKKWNWLAPTLQRNADSTAVFLVLSIILVLVIVLAAFSF